MRITLSPDDEQFVQEQAKAQGFDSPNDFVAELIHREWKRRVAQRLGITPAYMAAYRAGMERYAADKKQVARDVAMAREWKPLEEEAWRMLDEEEARGKKIPSKKRRGPSRAVRSGTRR